MDTKLQPFLRTLHKFIPVSQSSELTPCIPNGNVTKEGVPQENIYGSSTGGSTDGKTSSTEHHDEGEPQPSSKDCLCLKKTAQKLKESFKCCHCSRQSCSRFLKQVFPFLRILKGYSIATDLPCDVIAGLTVGIMHIPQGMAYALLTQLPAVYGLYTSFFPVLVYFFFGTSKHISVGTFAVICMMVGAVVDKGHISWQQTEVLGAIDDINSGHNVTHFVGDESSARETTLINITDSTHVLRQARLTELASLKVGYAMAATFTVGLLQVFLGIMRLGFITKFLSDPLISGFTTGAAVHVFSSQIKVAFGIKVERFSGPFKIIFAYKDFLSKLGSTNWVTLVATVTSIIVLVIIREGINGNRIIKAKLRGIPIPGELILIIVGTVLSLRYSLSQEFNVQVIGHIPQGIPAFDITFVKYLPDVVGESIAICFTAFAISFAIAKILADAHNYKVDPNQELIAHGLSNLVGCMFSAFCSCSSLSRSMVQDCVGGRTEIVSLVSCVLVIVVLLTLGPLFEALPNCILAAIIMVSLKGLFLQFGEIRRLWKSCRVDCAVWLVTFTSTVFLDVDLGLLIGLVYNLIPLLLRTQKAYYCLLGRMPGTDVYVDTKLYPQALPVPGIKIFRFDAPLYFGNIESFRAALIEATCVNPHELKMVKAQLLEDTDAVLQHHTERVTDSYIWSDEEKDKHDQSELQTEQHLSTECKTFAIIIDGSSIQSMDSVTARNITQIVLEYRDVDIEVLLGECRDDMRLMFSNPGFYGHMYRRNICKTISQAVHVAMKSAGMPRMSLVSTYIMDPQDFLESGKQTSIHTAVSVESEEKIAPKECE